MKPLLKWWHQYKYRFVPWIALNLKDRSVRAVPSTSKDKLVSDNELLEELQSIFSAFNFNEDAEISVNSKHAKNMEVMRQKMGFNLSRGQSSLEAGGRGVFVHKGTIKEGQLVAMYPGTVYSLADPILFQSFANPFIFRCIDGILIDGNDRNLSKFLFKSCANRDVVGPYRVCDSSWLTEAPVNPLAIGQYINNQSKDHPYNVAYQELNIPLDFPLFLRKFIPNIFYSSSINFIGVERLMRVVVLVSTREVAEGEELFSSYFTIVNK